MSRKVWIAIGVVGGGFLLYEIFKPGGLVRPTTRPTISSTSGGAIVSGLIAPIAALGTAIASFSNVPPAATRSTGWGSTDSSLPGYSVAADPSNVNSTTTGIDPTTGGAILPAGQAYGPPAPVSTADDGLVSPDVVSA